MSLEVELGHLIKGHILNNIITILKKEINEDSENVIEKFQINTLTHLVEYYGKMLDMNTNLLSIKNHKWLTQEEYQFLNSAIDKGEFKIKKKGICSFISEKGINKGKICCKATDDKMEEGFRCKSHSKNTTPVKEVEENIEEIEDNGITILDQSDIDTEEENSEPLLSDEEDAMIANFDPKEMKIKEEKGKMEFGEYMQLREGCTYTTSQMNTKEGKHIGYVCGLCIVNKGVDEEDRRCKNHIKNTSTKKFLNLLEINT